MPTERIVYLCNNKAKGFLSEFSCLSLGIPTAHTAYTDSAHSTRMLRLVVLNERLRFLLLSGTSVVHIISPPAVA